MSSNGNERAKEEESLRGLKELGKKDKVLVGDDKCEQECSSEVFFVLHSLIIDSRGL